MKTKTVLLCRVSSKEQEESGYSLPAQEKLLKEYSQKKSFKSTKVFSISESASGKKQREIFDQMMSYTKKHQVKVLICEKADRLTRNFKDMVMIDEWLDMDKERQVHLVKDSLILHRNSRSQEKLNWGIRILFAKNYIDNLSEEVKKGQKEKLAQGWLPTKPPIGYLTIGEKGHKTHIIDKEKVPLIKRMFELYASGDYSLKKLTDKMYEEGLKSGGGSKIAKSRIHSLLTNSFYIGKNQWNGGLYEGNQEIFINEDVFRKVQGLLKSKTTPKYRKHNFLFKSLLDCKECEGTITWETQKNIIYGHCNHYRDCTQQTWAKEEKVEKQLLSKLDDLKIKNKRIASWIRKALKESHKDEIEYHSSTQNDLKMQYDKLQKRLDGLYDDKLDEKISEDFYNRKFKQFSEEKEVITQSIQKHSRSNTKYYQLGINIYDLSQKAKQIYLKAKKKKMIDKQRQLMRFVFTKLTLDEGKVGFEHTPAFELLYAAVKATNSSKIAKRVKNGEGIFEPDKRSNISGKSDDFDSQCSALLPGKDSNLLLFTILLRLLFEHE